MLQLQGAEQRVVLSPCSWETYERLLSERSTPRLTYCEGALEIMSPSLEHEELSEAIKQIVSVLCEEIGLEMRPLGSTTVRRFDLRQGVEPDSAFYFDQTHRNPEIDSPDLMVEVEISRSALDKLAILARMGVPEVWRCDDHQVRILRLFEGEYRETDRSQFLPLNSGTLRHLLTRSMTLKRNEWLRELRETFRP
jgi:Uma2 family endonuclease